jgi:hypothetical protein
MNEIICPTHTSINARAPSREIRLFLIIELITVFSIFYPVYQDFPVLPKIS